MNKPDMLQEGDRQRDRDHDRREPKKGTNTLDHTVTNGREKRSELHYRTLSEWNCRRPGVPGNRLFQRRKRLQDAVHGGGLAVEPHVKSSPQGNRITLQETAKGNGKLPLRQ